MKTLDKVFDELTDFLEKEIEICNNVITKTSVSKQKIQFEAKKEAFVEVFNFLYPEQKEKQQ